MPKGEPGAQRLDWESLTQRIHPAASRVNMLAETTPAMFIAFDLLARGDRDLQAEPFSERRAQLVDLLARAAASDPRHADDRRMPTLARALAERVRGGGARRRRRQAARAAVRAEQAHDVQDQARPHGGCRRDGLPDPQVGSRASDRCWSGCTPTTARCIRSAPSRPGPTRGGSSSSTSSRRSSQRDDAGAARQERGREVAVLRAGSRLVVRAPPPGARARGALRPARGLALPPHRAVRSLAARPRPRIVHVRAARVRRGLRRRSRAGLIRRVSRHRNRRSAPESDHRAGRIRIRCRHPIPVTLRRVSGPGRRRSSSRGSSGSAARAAAHPASSGSRAGTAARRARSTGRAATTRAACRCVRACRGSPPTGRRCRRAAAAPSAP